MQLKPYFIFKQIHRQVLKIPDVNSIGIGPGCLEIKCRKIPENVAKNIGSLKLNWIVDNVEDFSCDSGQKLLMFRNDD